MSFYRITLTKVQGCNIIVEVPDGVILKKGEMPGDSEERIYELTDEIDNGDWEFVETSILDVLPILREHFQGKPHQLRVSAL